MSLATITSLRRGLHEWATRPGNEKFLRSDQEQQLRRGLADPTRRTQAHVAGWMLGTWHLGHGMHRVLDGDSGGFDEARQGQGLRRASLLARAAAPVRQRGRRGEKVRLPFSLSHGAWTALLGLALHDPGAAPLYEWLLGLPDIAFTEHDSLPFFTRELLALRAGRRINRSSRLGVYDEVMQHWDGDERLLSRALADVLDWHLEQARGSNATFDDPACRLYPLEVHAVRHVREWLELPVPKVDHPLMHGNLGKMRPGTPWPQHELVRQLERLAR
ncbi:MAG: hypothetical protein KAI24_02665, partial [Planctomycetes bacterium]|nr:hypothetical protein [Planctomycetota bacterium]